MVTLFRWLFRATVALIVFIGIGHFQAFQQFLPFLRLDGYYVVSDLIGVPNLFAYMRPVLMRMAIRAKLMTPRHTSFRMQFSRHSASVRTSPANVISLPAKRTSLRNSSGCSTHGRCPLSVMISRRLSWCPAATARARPRR